MREIQAQTIQDTIYDLILKASYDIGSDIYNCVKNCAACEESPSGKAVLEQLVENYDIAARERGKSLFDMPHDPKKKNVLFK